MSTKIYNGYEIANSKMSLGDLRDFCKELQVKFEKTKRLSIKKLITEKIIEEIDLRAVGIIIPTKDDLAHSVISKIWESLDREASAVKEKGNRNCEVDFSSSVTFIPIKGKLLALFYAESETFFKLWESQSLVKDYHYQNSSDRPRKVSKAEWEQRKRDWDLALPGLGIPSQNGFSFAFTDYHLNATSIKDILKSVPSFESRVKNATNDFVRDQYFKKHCPEPITDSTVVVRVLMEFADWKKTPEGKADLLILQKDIAKVLKKNLTEVDLRGII
jgi:hypothetical protein